MKTLVLFFLAGENVRARYLDAMREAGVVDDIDLVMALPGAGSVRNERFVLDSPGALEESRLEKVARRMGALPLDRYARIVVASYSAGYGAARVLLEQQRSADRVDGYCAIDSVHDGSALARLDWLEAYGERALAGDAVLWLGHTDVPTYDYASTTTVSGELCRRLGHPVPPPPEATAAEPNTTERAGLRVGAYNTRPAAQAKAEHSAALLEWGPELLAGCVARVLEQARERVTSPDLGPAWGADPGWSLGERICYWLGGEAAGDVREIPGPRHDPRILEYSQHCRRGGRLLGVDASGAPRWAGGVPLRLPRDEDAWCAAARSAALLGALRPGETPPHGLRVAVRELVEDARAAGTLRTAGSGYTPRPGDAAIMGRNGQTPLRGGQGHVRTVVQVIDRERYVGVGGNEGNALVTGVHRLADAEAWIATG